MEKSIDLQINDAKKELLNFVNNNKLPLSVNGLIVQELLNVINIELNKKIQSELGGGK